MSEILRTRVSKDPRTYALIALDVLEKDVSISTALMKALMCFIWEEKFNELVDIIPERVIKNPTFQSSLRQLMSTGERENKIMYPRKGVKGLYKLIVGHCTLDDMKLLLRICPLDVYKNYTPEKFKNSRELALMAIKSCWACYAFVGHKLKNCREFSKLAIQINWRCFGLMLPKMCDDFDLFCYTLTLDVTAFPKGTQKARNEYTKQQLDSFIRGDETTLVADLCFRYMIKTSFWENHPDKYELKRYSIKSIERRVKNFRFLPEQDKYDKDVLKAAFDRKKFKQDEVVVEQDQIQTPQERRMVLYNIKFAPFGVSERLSFILTAYGYLKEKNSISFLSDPNVAVLIKRVFTHAETVESRRNESDCNLVLQSEGTESEQKQRKNLILLARNLRVRFRSDYRHFHPAIQVVGGSHKNKKRPIITYITDGV